MAISDAYIKVDDLEPGDLVDTGGIYYGPYDAVTCLAVGEDRIAVHVKGHAQYWSQIRHYIPARVIVFERIGVEADGRWRAKRIFDRETGTNHREVKDKGIAIALRHEMGEHRMETGAEYEGD